MALLHNSNIEELVNLNVKGNVARVGGRMNQLLSYKQCKVTDINIIDGGYGMVRNKLSIQTLNSLYRTYKRQLRQEIVYLLHGECEMRDRKTVILDMHFARFKDSLAAKFDVSISSNVLEHSPNPIWLLLNFYFITKPGGYQYHAIPNYRFTYDQFRKPTSLSHMIDDFESKKWFDDATHNQDYIQSAIEKHGHQKEFHQKYPVSYPYMHFHVFDEANVKQLIEYMFCEVTVDCIKSEKYNDNIVFFKNELNPEFATKYKNYIKEIEHYIKHSV